MKFMWEGLGELTLTCCDSVDDIALDVIFVRLQSLDWFISDVRNFNSACLGLVSELFNYGRLA